MNNVQNKSKEFLNSIAKIKKLAHREKKSKDFYPMMLFTLKIIKSDNEKYTNNDEYYGMKTSDLTKLLCITKPATSKMLNLLEENQYIERSSNKNDRRVVYVKITKEGEEFLRKQNEKFENLTCQLIEKMGEEDIDNLIRLFGKLYDAIEELQKENNLR